MMYLLTEEEMIGVKANAAIAKKCKPISQELCTRIADTMPITLGWGIWAKKPEPWGCILTEESEWYCDACPVKDICPNPDKSLSK